MKKHLAYKDPRTWGMKIYHEYVAQSMAQGFKWIKYERDGDTLTIFDLRNSGISSSVMDRECADRYERWYQWMKTKSNKSLQAIC